VEARSRAAKADGETAEAYAGAPLLRHHLFFLITSTIFLPWLVRTTAFSSWPMISSGRYRFFDMLASPSNRSENH